MDIRCWQCGQLASGVILPLSRREECPHCRAELHACRQCTHFQAHRADQCMEERAERVSDKTQSNFCDYFQLNVEVLAEASASSSADQVSPELAALFGLAPDQSEQESASGNPLDSLFDSDDASETEQ